MKGTILGDWLGGEERTIEPLVQYKGCNKVEIPRSVVKVVDREVLIPITNFSEHVSQ